MKSRELLALSRGGEEGETEISSPGVGTFRPRVKVGSVLLAGQSVGELFVLGTSFDVLLGNVEGQVSALSIEDREKPVHYGEPLIRLRSFSLSAGDSPAGVISGDGADTSLDGIVIRSPTVGVFYLRPNPTSSTYVELGDEVEVGQTLGLVEVMKCFNQIRYEGAGNPQKARVEKILAADGEEVANDQPLFVLHGA